VTPFCTAEIDVTAGKENTDLLFSGGAGKERRNFGFPAVRAQEEIAVSNFTGSLLTATSSFYTWSAGDTKIGLAAESRALCRTNAIGAGENDENERERERTPFRN